MKGDENEINRLTNRGGSEGGCLTESEGYMVYHICNKSIARFKIFNNANDYMRMLMTILYYFRNSNPRISLSDFLRSSKTKKIDKIEKIMSLPKTQDFILIIAYCLMPTHIHLLLKELKENAISIFMNNVLNSYTRYFNIRHKRKGPLWVGPHKKVLIETDEQLLYVTGYIHSNPVKDRLVSKPEEWIYSSYKEYINEIPNNKKICNYNDILDIESREYRKFVEDIIVYQQQSTGMEHLFLE